MSDNYKIFNDLVNDISIKTGMKELEISKFTKHNSGYIANVRSKYKNHGKDPSEKFIDRLRLHFYKDGVIINPKKEPQKEPQKETETKPVDLSQAIIRDLSKSIIVLSETVNSNSHQDYISIPKTFIIKLSEVLAKKYSLNESEIVLEISNFLFIFRASL